ncbi:MAG: phage antirepressor protein, partial [Deltaproteobacteria bacterium CG07_land_8_20_14_0_80_38_7]
RQKLEIETGSKVVTTNNYLPRKDEQKKIKGQ